MTTFEELSLLELLKLTYSDEEKTNFCGVQLSVPSFEDCLLFTLNGKALIHRDATAGKVDGGHI